MLATIKARLAAAYAALKGGAWVSTLAFLLATANSLGLLNGAQVTAAQTTASSVLSAVTAAAALVHGFHVNRLLNPPPPVTLAPVTITLASPVPPAAPVETAAAPVAPAEPAVATPPNLEPVPDTPPAAA